MRLQAHKGFTLIELLVVIAVIAILMSILVPALHSAREQAKRAKCTASLRAIGQGIAMYAMESADRIPPPYLLGSPPVTPESLSVSKPWLSYAAYNIDQSLWPDNHITGGPFNLAFLYQAKLITQPEVFYCSAAPLQTGDPTTAAGVSYHYDRYRDNEHPWPWNTQVYHDHLTRVSYNYMPQSKDGGKDSNPRKYPGAITPGFTVLATKGSQLWEGSTVCTDLLKDLATLPHVASAEKGKGLNVLYGDSSVKWNTNPDAFAPALWNPGPNADYTNFRFVLHELQQ